MLNGFSLEYDGKLLYDNDGFAKVSDLQTGRNDRGATVNTSIFISKTEDVEVKNIRVSHPGLSIIEKWVEVINKSDKSIKIARIDSVHAILPADGYRLKYFTSGWGKEFAPCDIRLEGTKVLEVTGGRSSWDMHPWFSLKGDSGSILTGAIAWSGNWIARFEPVPGNLYRVTAGLSNWSFHKVLGPGESMEGVHVVYCSLPDGDLSDTAAEFGRWGRKYWYPRNEFSDSMPVEWNSWWPYEDHKVSEDIVKQNAVECEKLGFDMCTQDAGWFGSHSDNDFWYNVRGDWHKVNLTRFPSGMRRLSDHIHAKGLKFGIWCEIEAVGDQADLHSTHPELVAKRDGKSLGYVCMGNPRTREWALKVIDTLVKDYQADWIKLDFNLNPGAGCNRTDHGHDEGDGLYEHYMSYYKLLDEIRERHPHIILENCSSGGLRIDLGIMKRTHRTHLSDPDYTEHHLQVFWGAVNMLHPSACLHFAWSQTLFGNGENKVNEPIQENMPVHVFDYYIRAVLTGTAGFSCRLPQLPEWCRERLKEHIAFYREVKQKFIRDSDMYLLTGQPQRDGKGERWNAYLYVTENRDEALIFVFRLAGGEKERVVRLKGLEPDTMYGVAYKDSGLFLDKNGRELMEEGLLFDSMQEESSEIVMLTKY